MTAFCWNFYKIFIVVFLGILGTHQEQYINSWTIYSETCLIRTLSKPKTRLNQTDFTVISTKSLCNLNLCKLNICLNLTNSAVSKALLYIYIRIYLVWLNPYNTIIYIACISLDKFHTQKRFPTCSKVNEKLCKKN